MICKTFIRNECKFTEYSFECNGLLALRIREVLNGPNKNNVCYFLFFTFRENVDREIFSSSYDIKYCNIEHWLKYLNQEERREAIYNLDLFTDQQ